MRWPFGPPHLTLKPSKKQKIETKKNRKTKKIPPKTAFQSSVKISFLGGGSKFPFFLTTWPTKRAPKNTIKIGVSVNQFLRKSFPSPPSSLSLSLSISLSRPLSPPLFALFLCIYISIDIYLYVNKKIYIYIYMLWGQ